MGPFVVRKPSTGNRCSFMLAHAVRTYESRNGVELSDEVLEAIFREWFTASRTMLPADADYEDSLRRFYSQLARVRYTSTGLIAAQQRASKLPLPNLPGLAPNTLKVAALFRELQREAGAGQVFICPLNTIVDYVKLRWPEQAALITRRLEHKKVIECVARGTPHIRGSRGKSTTWRYLKPL